ncbi:hypothetical protein TNIN_2481 [Trichonephila inaurata madagascariensis]|uniref:Uncharacterized protein n=1 Tax=Trichonephila inaurata madagascariensis TaxID=2747483 RepID=A0A8X7BP47_9ARAC|nr:hypothetical protein TNIN_2481 [Trichonephila inaurata madagascariensis]
MPDFNAFYESFFSDHRQEEEPMDWEDIPFLPEVSAPFFPSRPPRKMRSLISVQVSEPPSLSANRFPNMRALVPKRIVDVSSHHWMLPMLFDPRITFIFLQVIL